MTHHLPGVCRTQPLLNPPLISTLHQTIDRRRNRAFFLTDSVIACASSDSTSHATRVAPASPPSGPCARQISLPLTTHCLRFSVCCFCGCFCRICCTQISPIEPIFSSILLYSPLFSSILFYSPLLSSILLYSPLFSSSLLYSLLFSFILPYSPLFSSILLYSPLFSFIHMLHKVVLIEFVVTYISET